MKGVTQAVVFEKGNVGMGEIELISKLLENANFTGNIMHTSGKSFGLGELAQILSVNASDKFNSLYNKFFYGFEKEGKSSFYQGNPFNDNSLTFREAR